MQAVFKSYSIHQQELFPLNLNDLVPLSHAARLIDQVVEKLDISAILAQYKGGGTSSYPPKMLLKILFYGYLNNTFSCRKLAKACTENIYFMWLSGGLKPDFRTINDFRGQKLKENVEKLFSQMVLMMVDLELVSLEKQFIDGTKLEANAHKYSFVWKKSVEKNKEKLQVKIDSVLSEIGRAIESDAVFVENQEVKNIDSKQLEEKIDAINKNIKTESLNKLQKKAVKKLAEEQLPKLKGYEQHLDILQDRNSYSKTDTDATFMRMKEDHMMNGQLKPAYNAQISTENQIIIHYTLHQNPTDTKTLQPHLENLKETYGEQVFQELQDITADAGYGSEENYDYLEKEGLTAYVKYNTFDKEQDKNYQKKHKPFSKENLHYNQDEDYYVCPMGQKMHKTYESKKTTEAGYVQYLSHYQAKNCQGCPLRGQCFQAKGNRSIERNHNLERHKQKIRELLTSEKGIQKRKQRTADVEPVFAQLKHNNNFRRFSLKGIEKTELEFGLMALAHNLRKKIAA
jgi:transposase